MISKHSRRKFVINTTKTVLGAAIITSPSWTLAETLVRSPRTTRGPFYPDQIPLDHDNDLIKVNDQKNESIGQVTHIFGQVLDTSGQPIPNTRVEIWQCDTRGIYLHTGDSRYENRDPAFQGFGRTVTDAEGKYRFRTIKPAHYPGRTPHIHFEVTGSGIRRLTTQMYVAGEPRNQTDSLFNWMSESEQKASSVNLEKRNDLEVDALGGLFNLIV